MLAAMSCSFWIDIQVLLCPHCALQGWMGLSSSVCVQANTLARRKEDCVLVFSFHWHIFQNLDNSYAQFIGLMLVFLSQLWMDFVMGTKVSSIYIDFCLNSAPWTMLRMHSPVLIVFIHFVAPLVAHIRIDVLTLVTCWIKNL